jgi:hypothetical protein
MQSDPDLAEAGFSGSGRSTSFRASRPPGAVTMAFIVSSLKIQKSPVLEVAGDREADKVDCPPDNVKKRIGRSVSRRLPPNPKPGADAVR